MVHLKKNVVAMAIVACIARNVYAFVPQSSNSRIATHELNAMPPMIIGPMIKKMREAEAKKKMPMIDNGDADGQAPGLRVGGSAWKWPPIWPYQADFFIPTEDIQTPDSSQQLQNMASMMSGNPQVPAPDEIETEEVETLDEVKYWSEEKSDVRTELDEEAIQQLTR
jgi:hypothetical protein